MVIAVGNLRLHRLRANLSASKLGQTLSSVNSEWPFAN
jgi:hypothetical protein